MKPKKSIIERSVYSEFFIEILWKTPSHFDLMDDYIQYLVDTTKYKNRKQVVEAFDIGITRKELENKIDSWNEIIGVKNKNKGPSYSKKIKNLIESGLVKSIDYPMSNKKYRYVINKFQVMDIILSLIVSDKSILKVYYGNKKVIKVNLKTDKDLYNFDEFIWRLFQDSVMRMSRYREDFREIKPTNYNSINNLKEQDSKVINSTIKDVIEHFIFYHAMIYFNHINTGKDLKFPGYGSSENYYYEEFLKCCWLYIEYNIFSSWLIMPYLNITGESPKLKVGKQ